MKHLPKPAHLPAERCSEAGPRRFMLLHGFNKHLSPRPPACRQMPAKPHSLSVRVRAQLGQIGVLKTLMEGALEGPRVQGKDEEN